MLILGLILLLSPFSLAKPYNKNLDQCMFEGCKCTIDKTSNKLYAYCHDLDLGNKTFPIRNKGREKSRKIDLIEIVRGKFSSFQKNAFSGSDVKHLLISDVNVELPEGLFNDVMVEMLDLRNVEVSDTHIDMHVFKPLYNSTKLLAFENNSLNLINSEKLSKFISNFSQLTNLKIIGNELNKIPNLLNPSIKLLEMTRNLIYTLDDVKLPKELTHLTLRYNQLIELKSEWFQFTTKLVYLDVSYNKLTYIHQDIFKYLTSLDSLMLRGNHLKRLPVLPNVLGDTLTKVDFSYQDACIEKLSDYMFEFITSGKRDPNRMIEINLSENFIESIEKKTFCYANSKNINLNLYDVTFTGDRIDVCAFRNYIDLNESIKNKNIQKDLAINVASLNCSLNISYLIQKLGLENELQCIDGKSGKLIYIKQTPFYESIHEVEALCQKHQREYDCRNKTPKYYKVEKEGEKRVVQRSVQSTLNDHTCILNYCSCQYDMTNALSKVRCVGSTKEIISRNSALEYNHSNTIESVYLYYLTYKELTRDLLNGLRIENLYLNNLGYEDNRPVALPVDLFTGVKYLNNLAIRTQLTSIDSRLFEPVESTLTSLYLNDNQLCKMDTKNLSEQLLILKNTLQYLVIRENHFKNFLFNLSQFKNLIGIDFSHNHIETLDNVGVLDNNTILPASLRNLKLAANHLYTINSKWFKGAINLESLDLSSNRIKFIPTDAFKHLSLLRYLYLNDNSLKELPSISYLSSMKILIISNQHSRGLTKISNFSFIKSNLNFIESIQNIDLSHNNLKKIEENAFCTLNLLNGFTERPELSISSLTFNNNDLTEIKACTFMKLLNKLNTNHQLNISIINNPELECTCDIAYLLKTYRNKLTLTGKCFDNKLKTYIDMNSYKCDENPFNKEFQYCDVNCEKF